MDVANIKPSDISLFNSTQQGLSLNLMTAKQQGIAIKGIIYKMGVVASCPIPNDPLHLKTLEEEVMKFIAENEAYSKLTFEEISTAARFNAAGLFDQKVKHWQNMFNLDYLGEILSEWIKLKYVVEKKINHALLMKNLFDTPSLQELPDEEAIQVSLHAFETTNDFMFINSNVYTILKKQGKLEISLDEKKRITDEATEKLKFLTSKMYIDLFFHEKYYETLKPIISMKIAVAEYFGTNSLQLSEINK